MMLVSADTALLSLDIASNILPNKVPKHKALWEYHKKDSIAGIPVKNLDRSLHIDTLLSLLLSFDLSGDVKVWTGWLSPLYPQALKLYKDIKQLLSQNKCSILDLKIQYSSSKDAYLILLTYITLLYTLNDRYAFLRLEKING